MWVRSIGGIPSHPPNLILHEQAVLEVVMVQRIGFYPIPCIHRMSCDLTTARTGQDHKVLALLQDFPSNLQHRIGSGCLTNQDWEGLGPTSRVAGRLQTVHGKVLDQVSSGLALRRRSALPSLQTVMGQEAHMHFQTIHQVSVHALSMDLDAPPLNQQEGHDAPQYQGLLP